MKKLGVILIAMLVLIAAAAGGLRVRYGGGVPFEDRSTPPMISSNGVQVVATLDDPPGNIAVSKNERIFITIHPESKPLKIKVAEVVNGELIPFPDQASQSMYQAPQGIRIDRQERLWTIDHADNGLGAPRLLAVDISTRKVVHQFDFPREIAPRLSYLQDLVISPDGKFVYIADVSFFRKSPGLVVYDVEKKSARRVLEKDKSVMPMNYIVQAYSGPLVRLGGLIAMKPGVDSIGLDEAGEWLYFGPMTHGTLFRARTADLRNESLSPAELSARVEEYGPKGITDGISLDSAGNVYLTDVEHAGVAVLGTDRKLRTYFRDSRVRWADGLSNGPDGWMYLADSDIPGIVLQSRSAIQSHAPFYLFRFKSIAPGTPGQ